MWFVVRFFQKSIYVCSNACACVKTVSRGKIDRWNTGREKSAQNAPKTRQGWKAGKFTILPTKARRKSKREPRKSRTPTAHKMTFAPMPYTGNRTQKRACVHFLSWCPQARAITGKAREKTWTHFGHILIFVFTGILGIIKAFWAKRKAVYFFIVNRLFLSYYRRDSNPYSLNDREILSLLRLPFRHCSTGVGR